MNFFFRLDLLEGEGVLLKISEHGSSCVLIGLLILSKGSETGSVGEMTVLESSSTRRILFKNWLPIQAPSQDPTGYGCTINIIITQSVKVGSEEVL